MVTSVVCRHHKNLLILNSKAAVKSAKCKTPFLESFNILQLKTYTKGKKRSLHPSLNRSQTLLSPLKIKCLNRFTIYSPPFVVSSDFIACLSSQNDRPPKTFVFWIANQNKDSNRPEIEKLLHCRTRSILKIMSSYRTSRHSVGIKGFNTLYKFFFKKWREISSSAPSSREGQWWNQTLLTSFRKNEVRKNKKNRWTKRSTDVQRLEQLFRGWT